MRVVLIGRGMFGRKVEASFSSQYDTLYVSDITFNETNLPQSDKTNVIYEPWIGIKALQEKICPSCYYLAIPHNEQKKLLEEILPYIPVLVEKPAIGSYSEIISIEKIRPLNSVAVGHVYLQCNGFKYIKEQICFNKSSPVCLYSERINENGPIRSNSCLEDLAIHDIYCLYDILRERYRKLDIDNISYYHLYNNKFTSRFMLSYENVFMDCTTSWIGPRKKRDWHVHFSNESLLWDGIKDTIFSTFNGQLVEPQNRLTPLQSQWNCLLEWAKNELETPTGLHTLEEAADCRYIIEHI